MFVVVVVFLFFLVFDVLVVFLFFLMVFVVFLFFLVVFVLAVFLFFAVVCYFISKNKCSRQDMVTALLLLPQ